MVDQKTTRQSAAGVPWGRVAISALLLIHLAAVALPPFTLATSTGSGSSSPLATSAMDAMRPYIDFAFLDHGYFFFAPDPGASHLMKYRLHFSDGREPIEATAPSRQAHWPRLYYHRHFMLSETLQRYAPMELPPPSMRTREMAQIHAANVAQYTRLRHSYEQHLLSKYGAERIELVRVEHRPPTTAEFLDQGFQLDDPRLYMELSEPSGGGARE